MMVSYEITQPTILLEPFDLYWMNSADLQTAHDHYGVSVLSTSRSSPLKQTSSSPENTTSMAGVVPAERKPGLSSPEETLVLGSGDKKDGKVDIKLESAAGYVTGFKLALVVGSVALACFLMLLDTMVISTVNRPYSILSCQSIAHHMKAIPRITDTFNSLPDIGWYASAYQFGRSVIFRNPPEEH